MKILYIARLIVLDDNIGVLNKIQNQVDSLIENKVDIDVFIYYKDQPKNIKINLFPEYFNFIKYNYFGIYRPIHLYQLWENISNLAKNNKYSIIYFRYPLSSFFLYKFLKKNKRRVILEHNTNELFEINCTFKRPLLYLMREKFYSKISFKYLLGNVGKSTDFIQHQEYKVGYNLNKITITNSIDVNSINQRCHRKKHVDNLITLIFVGNVSMWHGLERLFSGIKKSNSKTNFKLYLVGRKTIFLDLIKKFKLENLLEKHLILTGFKIGEDLDKLFNESDFAIGSLGLHRLKIVNGVPLKHREYLSRGIPFVYSGIDEDINSELEPYLYNVIANESLIEFDKLLIFIKNQIENRNKVSNIIRKYAIENIHTNIKTLELINFFNKSLEISRNES